MAPLIELYNTTHSRLVAWVVQTYGLSQTAGGQSQFLNPHRMRRETVARRLRMYRNQHAVDVELVIGSIYEDSEYIAKLKKLVPVALEQNITQRIVNEVASLYDLPPVRLLKDERQRPRFAAECERMGVDEIMQEAHRLTMLCGETLMWQFEGADAKNKLRIVTPDLFDAIPHPRDQLTEAGIVFDQKPAAIGTPDFVACLPHFELWDDTYRYLINAHGSIVDAMGKPVPEPMRHNLGRIPGVLFHWKEPTTAILDPSHTADIESAHLGVALLEVMIMRLSKAQGENQPVLAGNLAGMAKGQKSDGERPWLLPPDVVAFMLEMKTDPEHYLKVKDDKVRSIGLSWGMSYDEMMQKVATSGKEWVARRAKLMELRNQQRPRAKRNDRATVSLMGFDSVGMRLDYQEQAIPQDAQEKLTLYKDKSAEGLDSPIAYLLREDPDMSPEEARELLQRNLRERGEFIKWVRELNVPLDANADNPGSSPQENGAKGGRPPSTSDDKGEPDYEVIVKEILDAA